MSRLLIGLVAFAACGGTPTADRRSGSGSASTGSAAAGSAAAVLPLDQDYERLAAESLALYVAIDTAFAASGTDCAVATQKLLAIEHDHAALITANATVVREGREAELRVALRPHEAQFAAAAQAVMTSPVMPACAKDAAFTAAFDGLSGPR